ncbi:serine/threonine-protein kinase chk2 (cds1) [Aspergillus udagawae]|nr:serine/threonine-protein kinase chk2 (cds1) [Aspergillus udagawae]
MAGRSGQEAIAAFLADHGALLPRGVTGRRASIIASRRGLQRLVRRLTVAYEAVAEMPLQRQSSRIMSGLPESLDIPWERQSDFPTDEVSFAELMEQYDIKTGFYQRYNMMQQIGKGHFATVYICSNRVTGVLFAVKIFQSHKSPSSSVFKDLHYEIQLLRELQKRSHPNLMRMADLFADFEKNRICLVMDLGKEGELFDIIVAKQNLTVAETRIIFTQLLSAIKFLHDRGWVHRDVKPENILVMDKNLTIQLSDFGLAKKLHTESGFEELTRPCVELQAVRFLVLFPSGQLLIYLDVAPEVIQASRNRRYGFGVDLWSSGVVLYICLCGFPPFSDDLYTEENPYTAMEQIRMGQYHYPSPYWDCVGDPALDLIDSMLTVDVDKRATARECLSHPWMCQESSISPNGENDAVWPFLWTCGR